MEINNEQLEIIKKAFWALDELLEGFSYREYEIHKQTGNSPIECHGILKANTEAQTLLQDLIKASRK